MEFLSPKWISIYIDCLVLLIILGGFFWGIKRGLKKSFIRLIFILICVVIAYFTFPYLLNGLLNMNIAAIPAGSINAWIASYVETALGSNAVNFAATVEILKTVVGLLAGSILFVLLFAVLKIITWPIFALTARQKKEAPKHRWLGSIVGIVQGFLLAFLFFIPLGGISDILNKAVTQTTTSGATNPIEALVPAEIKPYVEVYENTVSSKVFGFIDLDKHAFNMITTTKIDGQKVNVNQEIDNILKVVDIAGKYDLVNLLQQNNGNYLEVLKVLYGNNETVVGQEPIRLLLQDLSNVIFDNSITKTLLVDTINMVGTEPTFNITNFTKLNMSDIDWAGDKTIFSSSIGNLMMAIKPIVLTGVVPEIKDMPLVEIGACLDSLKSMTLVDKIFAPLIVYGLKTSGADVTLAEQGIVLTEEIIKTTSLTSLCKAAKDAFVLMDKLQNNGGLSLSGDDLDGIFDAINGLDEKLLPQIENAAKKAIEEIFPKDETGSAILPPNWEEMNLGLGLKENQEALKGAVDVVDVVNKVISDPSNIEVGKAELDKVVESLDKIAGMGDGLKEVTKAIVNSQLEAIGTSLGLPTMPEITDVVETINNEKEILTTVVEQFVLPAEEKTPIDEVKANAIIDAALKSSLVTNLVLATAPKDESNNITGSLITTLTEEEKTAISSALNTNSNVTPENKAAMENLMKAMFGVGLSPSV